MGYSNVTDDSRDTTLPESPPLTQVTLRETDGPRSLTPHFGPHSVATGSDRLGHKVL